jgi:hypothetical protein
MARRFFSLWSLFILFLMRGIRFLYKVAHKMCALCKFSLLGALPSFAAVELFLSRTAAELFSHEMLTKFFELQLWRVSKNAHENFWASVMVGFRERSLIVFEHWRWRVSVSADVFLKLRLWWISEWRLCDGLATGPVTVRRLVSVLRKRQNSIRGSANGTGD